MIPDILRKIPHLSKELNLLGYAKLPFVITDEDKVDNVIKLDCPDYHVFNLDRKVITFSSNRMVDSLISVCLQLVNDMKLSCNDPPADTLDRLKFENSNLQKSVQSLKKELEKKLRAISSGNEKCKQLNLKIKQLREKIKIIEKEKIKISESNQSNEDIMKHKNKKMEKDITELQHLLYKRFNLVDLKKLPDNIEIIHAKQPDFKKLWSEVNYASKHNKVEILKKAVCVFQENNELLLDENSTLKTLILFTVDEIHYYIKLLSNKMNIPIKIYDKKEIIEIFAADIGLYSHKYKKFLQKLLEVFDNILNYIQV